jgi:hypothetical protein
VCAPNGVTYSRAAIEKAALFPASQLYRNALVQEQIWQWQRFVQENQHRFNCPYCHELIIDPVSLSCCQRNFCKLCVEREQPKDGEQRYWNLKCPVCREVTELAANQPPPVNQELASLFALLIGNAHIDQERNERMQRQEKESQLKKRVAPYLCSLRLCMLRRTMDGACRGKAVWRMSELLEVVRTRFQELAPQQSPILLDELDLALACQADEGFRFGNLLFTRDYSQLEKLLSSADGKLSQAQAMNEPFWLGELLNRMLRNEEMTARMASNFLSFNFPEESWDHIDLGELYEDRSAYVMRFAEQLTEQDLEACPDGDCDAQEEVEDDEDDD